MRQFESLAGYSAVIDRLGQFQEAMESCKLDQPDEVGNVRMTLVDTGLDTDSQQPLLEIDNLTLVTPDRKKTLIRDLGLQVGRVFFSLILVCCATGLLRPCWKNLYEISEEKVN